MGTDWSTIATWWMNLEKWLDFFYIWNMQSKNPQERASQQYDGTDTFKKDKEIFDRS